MSLASYIGTNSIIPTDLEREDLYDDSFWIGDCFSSTYEKINVQKKHFTTKYVYEVSSHWGIEICNDKSSDQEALRKLRQLIAHLKKYLQAGDFFELYSCWVGEEKDPKDDHLTIHIDEIDWQTIEIPEKTLVTFKF